MIQTPTTGRQVMFDVLLTRPSAIARHRSGPLVKERLLYLAHCEQIGIKRETLHKIAAHQLHLVRVLDLQDDDSLNLPRLKRGTGNGLCPRNVNHDHAVVDASSVMRAMVAFSGLARRTGSGAPHPCTRGCNFRHLYDQRAGLVRCYIEGVRRTVDCFFVWLDTVGSDLASVDITVIDQFITRCHARDYSRSTIHLYASNFVLSSVLRTAGLVHVGSGRRHHAAAALSWQVNSKGIKSGRGRPSARHH